MRDEQDQYDDNFLKDFEVLGDAIPIQNPLVEEEEEMEVYVTNIKSPYKFWIQLKSQQVQMSKLFDSMQALYIKNEMKLQLPREYRLHNIACAAKYKQDQVRIN